MFFFFLRRRRNSAVARIARAPTPPTTPPTIAPMGVFFFSDSVTVSGSGVELPVTMAGGAPDAEADERVATRDTEAEVGELVVSAVSVVSVSVLMEVRDVRDADAVVKGW